MRPRLPKIRALAKRGLEQWKPVWLVLMDIGLDEGRREKFEVIIVGGPVGETANEFDRLGWIAHHHGHDIRAVDPEDFVPIGVVHSQ